MTREAILKNVVQGVYAGPEFAAADAATTTAADASMAAVRNYTHETAPTGRRTGRPSRPPSRRWCSRTRSQRRSSWRASQCIIIYLPIHMCPSVQVDRARGIIQQTRLPTYRGTLSRQTSAL